MDENNNWKSRVLFLGGIIGALTGLGAMYLLVRRSELQGMRPKIGTGDGIKLGMGVLGLFRLIAQLGEGES